MRAQNFTGANGAALATLHGDKLVWLGAVGQNPPKAGDRWSLAGSFANLCLGRRTRPQRCDDVEGDGRVDASFRGLRAKSLALAPVHDEGKVTGILAVFSDNSRAFNGMHTAVLQTEADSLAELVQQARRAAGIQDEAQQEPEAPRPVEAPAVPVAAQPPAAPETPSQREFEAYESAFVVVPPPVAVTPSAPAVLPASPVLPAAPAAAAPTALPPAPAAPALAAPVVEHSLPRLRLVPSPAPGLAPSSAEPPSLPGFMPLSATAAALAKAKPVPPMPAEVVVEKKAPKKPAGAPPQPAIELKNPGAPWLMTAPAAVPTPPPAPAAVVPQASAPASVAAPRASAPVKTPPPAPAPASATPARVKFVPLAKPPEVKSPPEVKTPPPGTVKPVSKTADDQEPLPAAADPFAEFSPAFVRAQARTHTTAAANRPTLAGLEAVGAPEPARISPGVRRLVLVAAAIVAVVGGGLWLRMRSHAARNKPAPVVAQAAAAPVAASQVAPPSPPPAGPVTATPASQTAAAGPAVPAAGSAPEKTSEKSAPAKPQAVATATRPAAPSVTAPATLDLKTPAPVATPLIARTQEPAPQTLLNVPVAASERLPDLPKPEAPARAISRVSIPVAAQLLSSVSPIYPAVAKPLHLESVVRLTAKVNAQGRVTNVVWVSGNTLFKDSAVSAVRQWRYKPATLDGQPVESTLEITLKFKP